MLCGFKHFSWHIRVRFSDVVRLHSEIQKALPGEGLVVFSPTKSWRFHETRPEFLEKREEEVAAYLRRVVGNAKLWALRPVREFFEVGSSSFAEDLGFKGKEGYVLKSSGGYRTSRALFTHFTKRWLVLKDSYVAYYEHSDDDQGDPKGVVLVDRSFKVLPSPRDPRELMLCTERRKVYLRLYGNNAHRRALEWLDAFKDFYGSQPRTQPLVDYAPLPPPHPGTLVPSCPGADRLTPVNSSQSAASHSSYGIQRATSQVWDPTATSSVEGDEETARSLANRSFAPLREDCPAAWYVCGREYMGAVARAISAAEKQIFIADWRMNPEVLLTRHPDPPVRLCDLLKRKADEGVKIFVLIYREVSETLQKKHRTAAIQAELQELHPTNIRVLRHPLHFSTGQYFWSHHDKIVVVDQQIAFCGGIDLTEGRFDDFLHRVSDVGYDTCDTTVTKSSELAGVEEDAEGPFADKDSEAKTSAGV
eukprot:CAMPEP_0119509772 /NCGR_PEP_ID=MMETSP1344-20130328/28949_1 /TAXON_ID=236787 /ORGANISM="Florenciella parvula, Strain CCMP2471" /LENGTH=476 /DNA_ID=CAMNT_0007546633 /DNA_START=27 /DNA_END=1453 /DNA_ORIENTATION=-